VRDCGSTTIIMSEKDIPSVTLYPEAVALAIITIIYTTGSAAAAGFTHILFKLNGKQVVCLSPPTPSTPSFLLSSTPIWD